MPVRDLLHYFRHIVIIISTRVMATEVEERRVSREIIWRIIKMIFPLIGCERNAEVQNERYLVIKLGTQVCGQKVGQKEREGNLVFQRCLMSNWDFLTGMSSRHHERHGCSPGRKDNTSDKLWLARNWVQGEHLRRHSGTQVLLRSEVSVAHVNFCVHWNFARN